MCSGGRAMARAAASLFTATEQATGGTGGKNSVVKASSSYQTLADRYWKDGGANVRDRAKPRHAGTSRRV